MTVKSSISLTDEQDAFVRALVEEGRYASVSAVLQQGLELLRHRTESEELELEALRKLVKRRRQGDFLTGAKMKGRISAIAEKKRQEHGV